MYMLRLFFFFQPSHKSNCKIKRSHSNLCNQFLYPRWRSIHIIHYLSGVINEPTATTNQRNNTILIMSRNSYHSHCHCLPEAPGHCSWLKTSKKEKLQKLFLYVQVCSRKLFSSAFAWLTQKQKKTWKCTNICLSFEVFHYALNLSQNAALIIHLCGKYSLPPRHALYLVR